MDMLGKIVKKDNDLVRTKISIDSVTSGRILASFISCINKNCQENSLIELDAKLFLDSSYGGSDYTKLKNCIRSLGSAFAEVEIFGKKKNIFESVPFFKFVSCHNGKIYGIFNDLIFPLLSDLGKNFTKYSLAEYIRLPSIYSQRVFEILKSWERLKKDKIEISLSNLMHMMNVPETLEEYKNFKVRVLDKSTKDINELTSLKFSWKPLKNGRSVEKIEFKFLRKSKNTIEVENKIAQTPMQIQLPIVTIPAYNPDLYNFRKLLDEK